MDTKLIITFVICTILATLLFSFLMGFGKKKKGGSQTEDKDDNAGTKNKNGLSSLFKAKRIEVNVPKSGSTSKKKSKTSPVNIILYDATRIYFEETELSGDIVDGIVKEYGNLGHKYSYLGRPVYQINKKMVEGVVKYIPVTIEETLKQPPSWLHRALNPQWVAIVYAVLSEKSILQKYGWLLLFLALIIFFIWSYAMK